MADDELVATIGRLVDEEHAARAEGADPERIEHLETTLDQCWDLLRQRRAAREAGIVDTSDVRPTQVVEGYQQ
jgi:hypothetical protein